VTAASAIRTVVGCALAGALAIAFSGCAAAPAGTAADYQVAVDAAEVILADAISFVPADGIIRSEVRVTDLETSQHRMQCGDTTSQYSNRVNLYLTAQTDEVQIIDAAGLRYVAAGWTETDLGEDGDGDDDEYHDPNGTYIRTLGSPEGYGLTISRGEDTDGVTILQYIVYAPCVANPADKPNNWGFRARG